MVALVGDNGAGKSTRIKAIHAPTPAIVLPLLKRGQTMTSGSLVKVFGWYDNEWGYSCRLVDLVGRLQ